MARPRSSLVLALALVACAPAPAPVTIDPDALDCPGARPPISDCVLRAFVAHCGGSGEPRFACHEHTGRCRWFAGGCVAVDHHGSDCDASEICCEASPDGSWPFADGWRPSRAGAVAQAIEDAASIGRRTLRFDAPSDVRASIAPMPLPTPPFVPRCSAGNPLALCDGTPLVGSPVSIAGDALVISLRNRDVSAETIHVEVLEDDDGALVARAFVRSDVEPTATAPLDCGTARSPAIALEGSLVLSAIDREEPATVHGRLHLVSADGHTLDATF